MKGRFLMMMAALAVLAGCAKKPEVKYVFYFIGDGMGINEVWGTQLYNEATGNGPATINFTQFPVKSFVTTVSYDQLVTDSAAGGTALSSGIKTYNGAIGVNPDTVAVTSIADWAKAAGYGTGVCTTVGINHATPSCFYAHTSKRQNYDDISNQLVTASLDFAAGGGFITQRGIEKTQADYIKACEEAGVTVLRGPSFDGIAQVDGRVLCLSGKDEDDVPFAIDRKEGDTQLKDFVQAGIDYLDAHFHDKGFFFMIEGGKVDYGGHNDDAAACFQDLTDMSYSVDLALDFYKKYPDETLIVITADHETGGLMLGAGRYSMNPELLKYQKMSKPALTDLFRSTFFPEGKKVEAPTWEEVKAFFGENLGLWKEVEVSPRAEASLKKIYDETFSKGGGDISEQSLYYANSKMVSDAIDVLDRAAGYQWAYGSHSGSPVGLYVQGKGWEQFTSVLDNTEIAPTIARLAGYKRLIL